MYIFTTLIGLDLVRLSGQIYSFTCEVANCNGCSNELEKYLIVKLLNYQANVISL
jgi:hypothetical protein